MNFNIQIIFKDDSSINDISCYYVMNSYEIDYTSCNDGNNYSFNLSDIFLITISYKILDTEFIVYNLFNSK